MKKIVVIIVASVFFLGLFFGCVNSSKQEPEKETPVGARKQHDTRVVVVCKNGKGRYLEKSLHKSESVTCGEIQPSSWKISQKSKRWTVILRFLARKRSSRKT